MYTLEIVYEHRPLVPVHRHAWVRRTPVRVLVIDGLNNHDWEAGTRAIRFIPDGTGRFTVGVLTFPAKPDFSRYDVVVSNFNGGHTNEGTRWPPETEEALAAFVRNGGGFVSFHAGGARSWQS